MRIPISIQALIVTLCTVAVCTGARAETAVLVVGDGLTTAQLDAVDAQVRSLAADLGPHQAADVTRTRLTSAGLACDWRDVDCLAQLGVICGTDKVVLVDASRAAVTLTLVDVNAGHAARKASAATAPAALQALRLPAAVDDARAPAPVASSPDSGVVREPSMVPLVTTGIAAVAVLVGAGLGTAGALTWIDRDSATATLAATENQANATTLADPLFVARVKDERDAFERADAQWEVTGQPLVAIGALVLGAGVGLATVSIVWAVSE